MPEGWIPLLTAQFLNTIKELVLARERNGAVRADGDAVAAQDHALVGVGHAGSALGGIKLAHVVRAERHTLALPRQRVGSIVGPHGMSSRGRPHVLSGALTGRGG